MEKRKVLLTTVLVLVMLGGLFVGSAMAAWYRISVAQTGQLSDGSVSILCSHTSSTPAWTGNMWFPVSSNYKKECLAVSLTAKANTQPMYIQAAGPGGTITSCVLAD